jgi:hypothetical protein
MKMAVIIFKTSRVAAEQTYSGPGISKKDKFSSISRELIF